MNRNHLEVIPKNDRFPSFQKPIIVGFYSLDGNRTYHSTAENLKYVYRIHPNRKLDLNEGFNTYQEKEETLENEEKINTLLAWLTSNQYLKNILDPKVEKSTFVCYRGLLTTIMRTPYENQEDWLICATKVENLIFLCAFYTDEKKQKIQQGRTAKERLFTYWGQKFEQYMLSDDPRQEPNVTGSVNANEELNLVYKSKLNNHSILYGAEVDGVDSSTPVYSDVNHLNAVKFVELKTSRIIQNEHQNRNFRKFKLIKWWSQSFMVGIENIICGFRDDNGIVHQLEDFQTKDIPKICDYLWSPCVCVSFLEDFFSFVENSLREESNFTTWKFYWKPGNNHVSGERIIHSNVYNILPDWFINQCKINLHE